MKKIMEQWGLLRIFSIRTSYRSNAESPSVETSTDSSNDLGERLMNLPIELKQMILCSFTPTERRHLRLINKAMLAVVDVSMSDVEEIEIFFYAGDHCFAQMKTINPYNGAVNRPHCTAVSSSLPFLLKWIGAQLKTLKLTIPTYISEKEDSRLRHLHQVIEVFEVLQALNSENACPKLKYLSLHMGKSSWDNEIILYEFLKYITKRQSQAMVTDRPAAFLHSLTLTNLPESTPDKTSTVDSLHSEKRQKFLQDILDQCHGLKELNVDSLLVRKDLPIVALRYPTTLTYLKTMRLGKTPGDLQTIIENCPNLQIVDLEIGFPRDDLDVHALASLPDLGELTFVGYTKKEDIMRMTEQCLAAFGDHPFGSSTARPLTQLKSVRRRCNGYEYYHLLLGGANCCITSLRLTWLPSWQECCCAPAVEQLFKMLKNDNTCPHLMELNINSCETVGYILASLEVIKDRQQLILQQLSYGKPDSLLKSGPHVYGLLNDLLTYVTKRQSAVLLGKPFLRSLSFGSAPEFMGFSYPSPLDLNEFINYLEQIHTTLQQILDQCNGLENLSIEGLGHEWINPNKKKDKELMELVPLRFPKTLEKLNDVWLDNTPSD